jgi:hypothetical protein
VTRHPFLLVVISLKALCVVVMYEQRGMAVIRVVDIAGA